MPSTTDLPEGEHTRPYEPSHGETATEAVITAVAEATGRSPLDMDPLVGKVDPDALNAVLSSDGAPESRVAVAFDYDGFRVVVTPGEVRVRPRE